MRSSKDIYNYTILHENTVLDMQELPVLVIWLTKEKSKLTEYICRIKINVRGNLIILISNLVMFVEINGLDAFVEICNY